MSHVQTTEADELALKASIQPVDIDYASIRATKKQATVFGAPKRKLAEMSQTKIWPIGNPIDHA